MLSRRRATRAGAVARGGTALGAFYDQLFVGTERGRVCLVGCLRDGADGGAAAAQQEERPLEHVVPGGKSVTQVLVLGEIGMVLVLCGGAVECVDAQRMKPRANPKVTGVKGEVVAMAINEDAVPDFGVCLATSHKVHLFRWTGDRHEALKTLNVSSFPLDVAWSRHSLCVALLDQVVLIDVQSQSTRKVHDAGFGGPGGGPTGPSPSPASSAFSPKLTNRASARRRSASITAVRHGSRVRTVQPGKFLLIIDSLGIIIDASGQPTGNTIVWSSAPSAVACTAGFAVSLHRDGRLVEVHSTDRHQSIVERLELDAAAADLVAPAPWNAARGAMAGGDDEPPDLADLAAGGGVLMLLASSNRVDRLGVISLQEHMNQLFEKLDIAGAFRVFEQKVLSAFDQDANEALKPGSALQKSLLRKLSSIDTSLTSRADLVSKFHVDAGLAMLRLGKVDRAFVEWRRADLAPEELLVYVPALRPDGAERMPPARMLRAEDLEVPDHQDQATTETPVDAFVSLVRGAKQDVSALVLSHLLEFFAAWSAKAPERSADVDEAMLRICLLEPSATAARLEELCGDPAHALNVEEDSELLLSRGMVHEAALLLASSPSTRRRGLQLWADLGAGTRVQEGHEGLEETVAFLKANHQDPELVWLFSGWVLRSKPRRGLAIFLEKSSLPPERVLEHLRSFEEDTPQEALCLRFLEFLAADPDARAFDLELAQEYLGVMERKAHLREPVHTNWASFLKRPETLLGMCDADVAEAELVLRRLEQSPIAADLVRERVDLLAKCGLHAQALELLVKDLRDPVAAEAYCVSHFTPRESADTTHNNNNPFLALLCLYFLPENADTFRQESLCLLEAHGDKVDPGEIVAKLPADMPLRDIRGYLGILFRRNVQALCGLRIHKNLSVAHNIKTRDQLMSLHARNATVTNDTKCRVCQQRILTNAFALDVDRNEATHFACVQERSR